MGVCYGTNAAQLCVFFGIRTMIFAVCEVVNLHSLALSQGGHLHHHHFQKLVKQNRKIRGSVILRHDGNHMRLTGCLLYG